MFSGISELHHLPRLAPEFYRAFAVVQWTVTLKNKTTSWLNDGFHFRFRELLLHAAMRENLFCPVYVLMPEHLHLIWMGLGSSGGCAKLDRWRRSAETPLPK